MMRVNLLVLCLISFFGDINAQSSSRDTLLIVHDPVMIRQDCIYYVFCTGYGISVFTLKDLKHRKTPEWAVQTIPKRYK